MHRVFGKGPYLLTLVFVVGLLLPDAHAGDGKKPATDAHGDALPDGALMRMGSMRWRHGDPITFVAYPPNSKTLVTATNDATLLIWDRETGKLLHRLTPPAANPVVKGVIRNNIYTQGLTRAAMTSDGKLLAVVLPNSSIQIWDAENGKAIRQIKGPLNGGTAMTFSPDGRMLAIRGSDRITYLYDSATGNELRKLKAQPPEGQNNRVVFGGSDGSTVAFSPDSKTLAMPDLEINNNRVIGLITFFDTATGKEIRRLDLPTSGIGAIAFSPDGKLLVHNNSNKIVIREADTGKELRQFVSNFGANLIVFAPDSKSMAIKSRDQTIRLYDPANGNLIRAFGNPPVAGANVGFINYNSAAATDVVFAPDGKTLIAGGNQAPRFFNVETGKEQELPSGGHRGAVSAVITTPDGKTILSRGADNVIRIWNAANGTEIRQFAEPAGTSSVAFSPDAKFVALASANGSIHLIDVANGKEKRQFKGHTNSTIALAFSQDGKRLASRGAFDGLIKIFEVETGTELKQITYQTINANANGGVIVRSNNANGGGSPLLFSPDGQTLVTYVAPQQYFVQGQQQAQPGSNCLRFWDVATGKEIRQFEMPPGRTINHLVFSPDGRLLISENVDKTVSVWETASGRERHHLGEPVAAPISNVSTSFVVINGIARNGQASSPVGTTIAMSPDGSLIASPGANQTIRVWDSSLAKEVGVFKGHNGDIASLSFAHDGKSLISGSKDTTILVWDLTRLKREPRPIVAELDGKDLDARWADLISNDAGAAGKSVQQLIAASKSAVAYLKEKVQPAVPVDPKKIDQWIADLDSSMFTKRSIAISQLEKLGELAIPALQKVLAGKSSLETRRRVEPLLEKLTSGNYSSEQVRIIRVIEVLEKSGTPEARQLLEHLATGAPGALTTRQAQAALDRQTTARQQP